MIRNTLFKIARSRNCCRSKQQGFALVEVIMSFVLLAIGIALALPSYHNMVEKRQVTNGAEQLAAFINSAQSVAMNTNEVVTISYFKTGKSDWCVGAISGPTACDCTETDKTVAGYCQIASQPFVLNGDHTGNLELTHDMNGDGAFAFDPIRGLSSGMDDPLILEMRSPSEDFRLNLQVSSSGNVVLCSDDSSHDVPGYAVCPAVGSAEES